jgi:glycosyltransferase involved in cell wall biosynthesis
MMSRMIEATYSNATLQHVRMAFSSDLGSLGKVSFRKLLQPFKVVSEALWRRLTGKFDVLYYAPSAPRTLPMMRDICILVLLRPFFSATIFHFHAAGISEMYGRIPGWLRPLYRLAYFYPELSIVLSEYNPKDAEFLKSKAIRQIYNGIPDESGEECSPRVASNHLRILFVGLICESKGALVLLEAASMLARTNSIQLKIVGEFESAAFEQRFLQLVQDRGLSKYVALEGVLTGEKKHDAYRWADVFCFPSFFEAESFGLVVAEAMQFCLPVVTTKWRGIQSLVVDGRTGYLVPIQDAESVAQKLRLLASSSELRAQLGLEGRRKYLREFTAEVFLKQMDEAFGLLRKR